jgi:AAA domain-containing protein
MKIISADERLREKSGVKMLIVGPAKIGKTSLLRTLDPARTLFLDLEAGDLAVKDVPVATLRPQTWDECRNLACFLTGPNPSLPPTACYSEAHYAAIRAEFESMQLERFDTYFVDSTTVAGRLCFRWSEQQPEAFSERTGKKDVRGAYGLHAREMIAWLTHLQHARGRNVIFVAILEKVIDEFNRAEWAIQIEGQKTGRELPGIVDQIVTMAAVDFADGQPPTRAFVCTTPNPWQFPAGDRSGKLEQIEEPHLGRLLAKLTGPGQRKPSSSSPTEQTLKTESRKEKAHA